MNMPESQGLIGAAQAGPRLAQPRVRECNIFVQQAIGGYVVNYHNNNVCDEHRAPRIAANNDELVIAVNKAIVEWIKMLEDEQQ